MRRPAAATRLRIQEERLKPVERVREPRLRRHLCFELIPPRAKDLALIGRQQSEQTIRRGAFAVAFGRVRGRIVGERITGINLDQIVNYDQLEDTRQINASRRVFAERQRGERQVPGVLGGIFQTGIVGERCAAKDGLKPVGLNEKGNLLVESIVRHRRIICEKPLTTMGHQKTLG